MGTRETRSGAPRGTREATDPGCPASATTQRMRGISRRKGNRVMRKGPIERMHERDRRESEQLRQEWLLEAWSEAVAQSAFEARCARESYPCPETPCPGRVLVTPVSSSAVALRCSKCGHGREYNPPSCPLPWGAVEFALQGGRISCPRCHRILPRGRRAGRTEHVVRCRFCLAVGMAREVGGRLVEP